MMYDIVMFFALSSVLLVTGFLCFVLGFLFTESLKPLFNVKPFNCRPCLTFWLNLLLGGITGYVFLHISETPLDLFARLLYGLVIVLAAFINFLVAKRNTIVRP